MPKLHEQVKTLKATLATLEQDMDNMIAYLNSPKFRCGSELDGYVNINDLMGDLVRFRNDAGYHKG